MEKISKSDRFNFKTHWAIYGVWYGRYSLWTKRRENALIIKGYDQSRI